jgi:phenylalanyl-tRNA synthetase beta chain
MPVVNVSIDRLKKFLPGVKMEKALEMLPFVGLDIEGDDSKVIRVEYNPNRPDFSSDYGIARALQGLMGIKLGMPALRVSKSNALIKVDRSVKKVRPHVVALVAKNGKLGDETIKHIIAMQEDLHNGICRRRKKASIGIHNLDAIKFPVKYSTVDGDFAFTPLGGQAGQTVDQILRDTETGRVYGHLLAGKYPVIIDSTGTVLSFPPIINGDTTRVDAKCKNLFVEVTAIDIKAAKDVLAVIAFTLHDAGFEIQTATIIDDGKEVVTPDVRPARMRVDINYVSSMLGLALTPRKMVDCLRKSRLEAKANKTAITCTIPRYRIDIAHPIDIVEEVAIGYGIYNMQPAFPPAVTAGQRSMQSTYFDAVRRTMVGLGMLEAFNSSLASKQVLYDLAGRQPQEVLAVDGTKSAEHEVLRDSLIPPLLQSLSRNVHEEYPQKLFEIGKTFSKTGGRIGESWKIAVVIAHGEAGYTEAKSALQVLFAAFGLHVSTKASSGPLFIKGRCAAITAGGREIGIIGEITPLAIDNFKLRVPVAAFEVDLSTRFSA